MIKRSIIFPFRDTRMIRRAFSFFFAYFWPKLALLRCVVGWFIHFEQQKKNIRMGRPSNNNNRLNGSVHIECVQIFLKKSFFENF